jgi:precorrin-2 dehydrogenase / sirohydrochlorin ferrochelatase
MQYYPINLDLRNKRCLVVGGGDVAERKVSSLLACGARVKIVTPEATQGLLALAEEGKLELAIRPFAPDDLREVFLVIASTDAAGVNSEISRLAQNAGTLVNVVDDPALCNFIVPATVTRGDLQISVSTGGSSPALAKRIRKDLEARYGVEYGVFAQLLGEIRDTVKAKYTKQSEREAVFNRLIDSGILELIVSGDQEAARKKALECI